MDSITVSDYRCFGEGPQTARLAPITLFVGENSTGKTSLLAMIRALWDAAFADLVPDFKEAPYDLGIFDEILHRRAEGASSRASFTASCEVRPHGGDEDRDSQTLFKVEEVVTPFKVEVEFGSQWSAPMPVRRRISRGERWGGAVFTRRRQAKASTSALNEISGRSNRTGIGIFSRRAVRRDGYIRC